MGSTGKKKVLPSKDLKNPNQGGVLLLHRIFWSGKENTTSTTKRLTNQVGYVVTGARFPFLMPMHLTDHGYMAAML